MKKGRCPTSEQLPWLLERLALPTCLFDEQARILEANTLFADLFDQAVDEVRLQTLQSLADRLLDANGEVINDPLFPLSMQYRGRNQEVVFAWKSPGVEKLRWFQVHLPREDRERANGSGTLVSFSEVSRLVAEKRTSSQVLQAKSEWESTVDALQDIVTIQDTEMRIVRANKVAHVLFGFALGDLKGKHCYEVFMQREQPCRHCPVTLTQQDGCPHTGNMYQPGLQKTFSVSTFPIFNGQGEMHQIVHVARDITRYLHDALEKNRMMAAIEQTSESVVITDIDGSVVYVNPAFETVSGYSRWEAIGKPASIIKSGMHDDAFYASMWQTLKMKQVWRGRLINRRKNGTIFKEDATISPVQDGSGLVVNYVAIKRDVTREEQFEQQLHQGLKMEALGTLAGGIAHDFNNILSAMIGYAEIAKDRLPPEHLAQQDLDQVIAGGDRAVDLVKQILTFSRQESYGQFRVFKLQYLIKEIIKLLSPSLPATIKLTHNIDASCRSIFADLGQIHQVVMNLCTNGIQSIGKNHGELHLRLREVNHEPQSAGEDRRVPGGAYLEFEVRDTGCGITEENLGRIFDPFFTTKIKEQGTGLGLAVVHGIIKKHRGEIRVSSTLGQGSAFTIYLPVDGREEKRVAEPVSAQCGGDERIMVVDDESTIGKVTAGLLGKCGYRVSCFADPIAAVKHFRNNPECCDLVLTDMIMPNMTGAELAREFLAQRPDLPIIMVTGHSDNFDRKRAEQLGIRAMLLKPVKSDKLYQTVRNVLSYGKDSDC